MTTNKNYGHQEYTTREYAAKEQVTTYTVRRWVAKGAVDVRRTAGGGIRVIEKKRIDKEDDAIGR